MPYPFLVEQYPWEKAVWLDSLQAQYAGGQLRLYAPNNFVADLIRRSKMNIIKEAAAKTLGQVPEIVIEIKERKLDIVQKPACHTMPMQQQVVSVEVQQTAQPRLPGVTLVPLSLTAGRFRFQNFVVGKFNRVAQAAAMGLCETGIQDNRLFISSGTGLGKTHLSCAVGYRLFNQCNKQNPYIVCMTGQRFAQYYGTAVREKWVGQFKNELLQKVDILILEDMHAFTGKATMQGELIGLLDALQERGGKTVLTSACRPSELSNLDDQLVSRFCSGLVTPIDFPDFEDRRCLVERSAQIQGVEIPLPVTELLADKVTNDIRKLHACLNNLIECARFLKNKITVSLAQETLKNFINSEVHLDRENILSFVCSAYGLSRQELRSKSRKAQNVLARNIAFFLLREHTEMSSTAIGREFNRQHSTVLNGIAKVERELKAQTASGRAMENVIQRLCSQPAF